MAVDRSNLGLLGARVGGVAMSHLSGVSVASQASSDVVTDTSTVGGATVEASLDLLDSLKAPKASPTLTGVPAAPTAAALTSTTQIATTAFVTTADNLKANIASPTLTGVPAAPTATPGTNTTQIATTAYADAIAALKVNAAFTPGDAGDWDGSPATVQAAIDRLAATVATLFAAPIP
jgi:hypothetical protein